jgi:DNA processing protein
MEQKERWLRLIRTRNIGPATFWRLLNHCGGAAAALEALPHFTRHSGHDIRPPSLSHVRKELKSAHKLGARLVARGEKGYPPLLARLEIPPPLLYVKGRRELAAKPAIAMVGSRNGSALGQKFPRRLGRDLTDAGFVIISGLARGIDAAAHEAALESGTIAAIAGGVGNYYPRQNEELQRHIEQEGLLISENPPLYEPKARDFPRRNRIISGSALGVIVMEAGPRSGSLITARLAGEQGREVMAVPGHPLDPRASGTNSLLMQGASMIRNASDALELLRPLHEKDGGSEIDDNRPADLRDEGEALPKPGILDETDAGERERILAALGPQQIEIDEIIRATSIEAGKAQAILTELAIIGRISFEGAHMVCLNI